MIIVKTPYRISLFGGSTDYKSFYSKYSSRLLGLAIDKYSYIALRHSPSIFDYKSSIQYSQVEKVQKNSDIKHNGVRGVLEYLNISYGIEMSHMADIPSQTGMGSSSSFIVGLLNACHKLSGQIVTPDILASEAIYIERELLNEPGGIQDQLWAAHGGFNCIDISKLGNVNIRPLPIGQDFIEEFLNRSCLIYLGKTRKSFDVSQSHDTTKGDGLKAKLNILELSNQAYEEFDNENLAGIATLLHESWQEKKKISPLIASSDVNEQYSFLLNTGMIGGKLLGSGKSGFIFGIWDKKIPKHLQNKSMDFRPDYFGSQIINS